MHSGKSLLRGTFPSEDQYGRALTGERASKANQQICNDWRACFESWTGDWKERALSHNFVRRNYQSTQVCDQCSAINPHTRTPACLMHLIYSNFSLDAPWRQTLRSHEDYLRQTPAAARTPWLAVPGFNLSRVRWDSAHTILLGTGKDIAGSFLCDLVPQLQLLSFTSIKIYTWSNIYAFMFICIFVKISNM